MAMKNALMSVTQITYIDSVECFSGLNSYAQTDVVRSNHLDSLCPPQMLLVYNSFIFRQSTINGLSYSTLK